MLFNISNENILLNFCKIEGTFSKYIFAKKESLDRGSETCKNIRKAVFAHKSRVDALINCTSFISLEYDFFADNDMFQSLPFNFSQQTFVFL